MRKMFKAVYPIKKRGGVRNGKNCCIVYFLKVIPITGDRGIVLVLRGEFGLAKKPRPTFGCPSVRKLPYMYEELETPSTSGEGEHKFTESYKHQHSASKRNRQRHLCMQDILFRWESNRSRFRSYAPAAVPSPLQASVLICPGFSFFCTFFLPPYRCIGIFLNLSLSALMPDGREEQSVCSVLVAPCIRSSSCSFLIAVVVASSINANLSLSIFFLPFCSLVSLLHI